MNEIKYHFDVDGDNFTSAGQASVSVKKSLRELGISSDICRKVAIAMYEGEINMVIHGHGGQADVVIDEEGITIILADQGPGIENLDLVMQEGYSTASESIRELGFGAGMGLPNMKKNSDEMIIETEVGCGTVITMRIKF